MKLLQTLFKPKPKTLAECEAYRVDNIKADTLLGGFKEYQPMFWELPNDPISLASTGDLLAGDHTNLNSSKK